MPKYEDCDFRGWATKNDILCTDGRTIKRDAFKHQDGQKVPIVWGHQHDSPEAVIGHGFLENRPEGVYIYGYLNDTPMGKAAKEGVNHGDITSLSIWANQLKQNRGDVLHGSIKEVSLVLAGANIGACIEYPMVAHGDDISEDETEAFIYMGDDNRIVHGEDLKVEPFEDSHEQKALEEVISHEEKGGTQMAESNDKSNDKSVQEVIDSMTEEQQKVLYYLVGAAASAKDDDDDDDNNDEKVEHSDTNDGGASMKYNAFEGAANNGGYISHDDMAVILKDAKSLGSLKEAVEYHMDNGVLAHDDASAGISRGTVPETGDKYGLYDTNMLFPEYRAVNPTPEWIKRDTGWVDRFLAAVHRSPFSRIKSLFADITEDEARAKGYLKGNLKKEEFFTLIKRVTDPQTVYKKQKMDRDDTVDITDFDVIAWIKGEMRIMLNEEIARACLIGDGRLPSADDKIQEAHIRPIVNDHELFTIKYAINKDVVEPKDIVEAAIRARKSYKGSGSPTCYLSTDTLTDLLLQTDRDGRDLYADDAALAKKMRVKNFEEVEPMEGFQLDGKDVYAIIVNPIDYTLGADKGGNISLFDDFDIDYNQMKYLMETRVSGALRRPKSAIVIMKGTVSNTGAGGTT